MLVIVSFARTSRFSEGHIFLVFDCCSESAIAGFSMNAGCVSVGVCGSFTCLDNVVQYNREISRGSVDKGGDVGSKISLVDQARMPGITSK